MHNATTNIENRLHRRDVARLAGVHVGTVARWERKGLLPGIKLNSRLTLYKESDVLRMLNGDLTTGKEAAQHDPATA